MAIPAILSVLGKSLKWVGISLVVIYGLLFAINSVDEDLSPEAKTLLALPHIKADPANGYLALVGMSAPLNEDAVDYGSQWVDAYNAATDSAAIKKADARFNGAKTIFRGDKELLCNPSKALCLPEAKKKGELWRKLSKDNELLLTRQRSLTGFTHFEESYFPPSIESPLLDYSAARLLELDMIALNAAEGQLIPALAALEARIAFDRRALLGCRSLISGLAVTAWLRSDYALLAEIVATGSPKIAAQKDRLLLMTEPLEISQIRSILGRLFQGDMRIVMHQVPEGGSEYVMSVLKPFFKKQATQNILARNLTTLTAQIQEYSPEKTDAWIKRTREIEKTSLVNAIYTWRFLYNPIGKFSLYEASSPNDPFILRLSNLIGITRLARLQVEIVTDSIRIPNADIPARIAANASLYDPYTGKPMGWDGSKQQLYFGARFDFPELTPKRIQAGI